MKDSFDTPILFLLFNRIETATAVFSKIREVQPKYIYLAADGGRDAAEQQLCLDVRDTIISMIDWECEVQTYFRDDNAGCGKNVSEAITWFFEHVEEGIILEDDCLPNFDFFHFCSKCLKTYRDNNKIFVIGGVNFQDKKRNENGLYFTRYGHIWGWATWKRAWKNYDYNLNEIDESTYLKRLKRIFKTNHEVNFFYGLLETMKNKKIDTWDYQWTIIQLYFETINILPTINLVKNIGFNEFGTHTHSEVEGISNQPTNPLNEIKIPKKIKLDQNADLYTFYNTNLIYDWKKMEKPNLTLIKIQYWISSLF